jgi:hypothetical protein
MNSSILSPLENLPYFTFEGFRQIAGDNLNNVEHARITIDRWVKAGHIIRLKKGKYMHRYFYERYHREPAFSAVVSSILEPLSYLSLEYVLQLHGVLTEITYPTSAITTKNTHTIVNSMGTFNYRHIKKDLFTGYQISEAFGIPYSQASKAKALFDYLYLRPQSARITFSDYDLAEDLRLNLEEFTIEDRIEFSGYVRDSRKPKMFRIGKNLESHIWRH